MYGDTCLWLRYQSSDLHFFIFIFYFSNKHIVVNPIYGKKIDFPRSWNFHRPDAHAGFCLSDSLHISLNTSKGRYKHGY